MHSSNPSFKQSINTLTLLNNDLQFCTRLTYLISLFSSLLIIFGGLIILGSILESIQINYWILNTSLIHKFKLRRLFNLFNGCLNLFTGFISIILLQCCTIPLVSYIKQFHYVSMKLIKQLSNCPMYLIVLICCFLCIPIQLCQPIINKLDNFLLNINKTTDLSSTLENSLTLFYYGYTINCLINSFTFPILILLLCCIVIDVYIRHNYLLRHLHKTTQQQQQQQQHDNDKQKSIEHEKCQYLLQNQLNNLKCPETTMSHIQYSQTLQLQNYAIPNTTTTNNNNIIGINQCQQVDDKQQCMKYTDLSKSNITINSMYENKRTPCITSNIQLTNNMNSVYLELDSIQPNNIITKNYEDNRIHMNVNDLSQIVYRCSMNSPPLIYHKYNELGQIIHSCSIEPCEYMSCDLQQQQQQQQQQHHHQQQQQQQQLHVSLYHPEINTTMNNLNNLTPSKLIKLFTDTGGEDFITSV
ncbi:hypothetical protein EWB00_002753 [Schistosoma japonicum]|uniref:Uncharacterized protein n=1 Tax=Schistosoma japonicum TaxID=6182 RepID=A0A4Z2DBV5_SCHJA|nr:hypothetical protein EWB00_002753 [Schistosoma japonicum]